MSRTTRRIIGSLVASGCFTETTLGAALLYREFLFTGDHLWGTDDGLHLSASRSVCWYSWPEQVRSIERLLDFEFEWVLPGHGRRFRAANPAAMRAELERLLKRVKSRA